MGGRSGAERRPKGRLRRRFAAGLVSLVAIVFAAVAGAGVLPHLSSNSAEYQYPEGSAVIPTTPDASASGDVITNYRAVTFPANDDSTWGTSPNSPEAYPLNFALNFFGTKYSSLYVNNNGNVTFDAPLAQYTPQDLTTFGSPIIAPFFADVDTTTGGSGVVNFGQGTYLGHKVFVVNWPAVGCYHQQTGTAFNTFQLLLIDRPDRSIGGQGDDFDIEFNYNTLRWDTGNASGGDEHCINGPSGASAYAGYTNGGADHFELPGSGVPNALLDSSAATGLIYNNVNSATPGRYEFSVVSGEPTAPTEVATTLSDESESSDHLTVPVGTSVNDSAVLSGEHAASATGTVHYQVYSDPGCKTLVRDLGSTPITTSGQLPSSAGATFTTPGAYYWQATYSGDEHNNGSLSVCGSEIETVFVPPPTNTEPPAITGTAQESQVLHALRGSWTYEPTAYTYQWERCDSKAAECEPIDGAHGENYEPSEDDVEHELLVEVTASNAGGKSTAPSAPVGPILPLPPTSVTPPEISGIAQQGDALTEIHGSWTREPTEFEYRWLRCDSFGEACVSISGATEQTYVLQPSDVGSTLEVEEFAKNAGGPSSPARSAPTAEVLPAPPVEISPPEITGTAQQGKELTEHHGSWENSPTIYEYAWLRCAADGGGCEPIAGAEAQGYTPSDVDVEHTLRVVETALNAGGSSKPATSEATAVVVPPVPLNTKPPLITGTARQGETLTEHHGSWEHSPAEYSYQWLQCDSLGVACINIGGATAQTYLPGSTDVGHTLRVQETATNAGGPSEPAMSEATSEVTAAAPVNQTPPGIAGTAQKGQALVGSAGSWSNEPTTLTQQWLRCNAGGESCEAIGGATTLTYIATAADVGHRLRLREVASNNGGSEPATSVASEVVSLVPLRAVAGEDVGTVTGLPVTFSGSGSSPAAEIDHYSWDFGDGSSGNGVSIPHSYSTPGSYKATLTVERGGESDHSSLTVTVASPPGKEAKITVDDEGDHPLGGADVLYIGPKGAKTQALTNSEGVANLPGLPDGTDTIYAYKSGFKPVASQVSISEGAGEATVKLSNGPIASSTLKDHEMTLTEIEEAGIDTSDPANNNVYEFEVKLAFPGPPGFEGEPPIPFHCYVNHDGEFVGHCYFPGFGGEPPHCYATACYGPGFVVYPGESEGHPYIQWLVLRGKAAVLKQFFMVSMVVQNLSPEPFKFAHGSASLTIPAGVSLAPTAAPQQQTQSVEDIPGEGSAEADWIVRGDKPGEYYLSADYHGQLEPFEAEVETQATLDKPLKVWGAEALGFHVEADSGFLQKGVPYHVRIGIVNKANVPLYNVNVTIDASSHERFVFQPQQAFEAGVSELAPGATVYAPEDILVPDAKSAGAFDPGLSSAHFVGEEVHPGEGIEAVSPPPLYALSASVDTTGLVHLHWQSSPGASGYEIFSTPNLDTAFSGAPDAVLTSPTSKSPVTQLPAGATDAYMHANIEEGPQFYAVSTIKGGGLRLEHPVNQPELPSGPAGGPLTIRELLAGGHNPSEFCIKCFMGKLLAFALPVDGPTGNFWHSFTDLSIPGRGIPLNLTRTYNSGAASADSPFGFGWSFPYGMSLSFPDATHVIVNQENGSAVEFSEEAGGKWVAPPRVTAALAHNGDGSWTFVRHRRETFSFDSGGRLTRETDLNGYATALSHDAKGRLTKVTDPSGRKLTFNYKGSHIISATDPMKRVVQYQYDPAGNLTDVIDVGGGDTHFTYDAQHRMLSMRMPNQAPGVPGSTEAALHNTYDGQGRVTAQTDPLDRETTFEYSGEPLGEAGGATTITDAKGNAVRQTYQFGELMSETRGYGSSEAATWKFEYDSNTLGVTSVTDSNAHTTKSTYDGEGNVLTREDALGRRTINTYDGLNDELTTTDPLGITSTMSYDARGNLLSQSRPLVGTSQVQLTKYTYGDASHPGDMTAMADPSGRVWRYTYDKYGNRTSWVDPVQGTTTSTYNIDGWKLTSVSPRGNASGKPAEYTTGYSYNNFGQATKTIDPLGHATLSEYDANQNLVVTSDAARNLTHYSYDADDERVAEHRANGSVTETTYWPDGSVKEQIDAAGHATSYGYDALGRRIAVTDPRGRTTHYGYDPVGNQTAVTDPEGQVTTMTYDAADERTSIGYSDGKTPNVTGITYDADGQRIAQTDGSGSWAGHWDSLHRLTSVTEGASGTVSYGYDLRGLVTALGYPNGKAVNKAYDGAGRLTSVTDWKHDTTSFSYDADGNVTKETTPTGVVDSFAFDRADQMVETTDKAGAKALFAAHYARNTNGQVAADSSAPAGKGSYGYTALNQVCYAGSSSGGSCSEPPAGASPYAYDNADNLTQNGATSQEFDAADQLCWSGSGSGSCSAPPAGATSYNYNERGDRTTTTPASGPSTALTYDQADRLTRFAQGTTKATYIYDGDGLRLSKTVGKANTTFAWDLSEELPLLLQAGKTSYIYGPEGLPVEQITGGTKPQWLHHDQLGSTRLITSNTGAVVGGYTYNPWGVVTSHTGTASSSLEFDGQYADTESGYQFLRARYYDPMTGQLLTRDPAVTETRAAYGFATNDPLNGADPTGLWGWNPISDARQAAGDVGHGIGAAGSFVGNHWRGIAQGGPLWPEPLPRARVSPA